MKQKSQIFYFKINVLYMTVQLDIDRHHEVKKRS